MAPPLKPLALADEPEALLDVAAVRDHAAFAARAVARHKGLCVALVLLTTAAGVLSLLALPKTYHVEVRLLAQHHGLMSALADPTRAIPFNNEDPARGAAEMVLNRENLVAMIRDHDLIAQWDRSRTPLLRAVDRLTALVSHPPTEADRVADLAGLMEKRIKVYSSDGVVHIEVDWPNAVTAAALADSAQNSFLAARQELETAPIGETIALLESHAKVEQAAVEEADSELHAAELRATKEVAALAEEEAAHTDHPLRAPKERTGPNPAVERARTALAEKRTAIADLESIRRRRLAELEANLATLRATYTPTHPAVKSAAQSLAAEQREPTELLALRREEQALVAQLEKAGEPTAPSGAGATLVSAPAPPPRPVTEGERAVEHARDRARAAYAKSEELVRRLGSARIELDAARAAFKYRYKVIKPAEVPKKPTKAHPGLMVAAGLFGGLALAVVAAALLDWRSGRLLQRWQLERQLHLRVLAEVPAR